MAGGRPTKYHDGLPELFVKAMEEGKSIIEFAAENDVCYETVRAWTHDDDKPEFSAAFTRGKTKGEAFWLRWLTSNFENTKVNAPLVKMYFANRFGWSDKKEVDATLSQKDNVERAVRQADENNK